MVGQRSLTPRTVVRVHDPEPILKAFGKVAEWLNASGLNPEDRLNGP